MYSERAKEMLGRTPPHPDLPASLSAPGLSFEQWLFGLALQSFIINGKDNCTFRENAQNALSQVKAAMNVLEKK